MSLFSNLCSRNVTCENFSTSVGFPSQLCECESIFTGMDSFLIQTHVSTKRYTHLITPFGVYGQTLMFCSSVYYKRFQFEKYILRPIPPSQSTEAFGGTMFVYLDHHQPRTHVTDSHDPTSNPGLIGNSTDCNQASYVCKCCREGFRTLQ